MMISKEFQSLSGVLGVCNRIFTEAAAKGSEHLQCEDSRKRPPLSTIKSLKSFIAGSVFVEIERLVGASENLQALQ